MRRAALLTLASLSLLLFLTTTTLALRTLTRADKLEYVSPTGHMLLLISKSGRLDLLYHPNWPATDPGLTYIPSSPSTTGGTDAGPRLLGFGAGSRPNGAHYVNLPYWFLALLTAILPALTLRAESRRRRSASHLCRHCGYDLRASPTRCPECGQPAP